MKRTILLFSFCTVAFMATAKDSYINVHSGYLHNRGVNLVTSYERETCCNNFYELFIDLYNQFNKCDRCGKFCKRSHKEFDYSVKIGAAYKPAFFKTYNQNIRGRFGADVGTDTKTLLSAAIIGVEYNYIFSNRIQVSIQQKNDVVFGLHQKIKFRNGLLVGIKIPLTK